MDELHDTWPDNSGTFHGVLVNGHPPNWGRPPRNRHLSARVKILVERDGEACCWCKRAMLFDPEDAGKTQYRSIEHLVRVADGGTNDLENLALACRGCNSGRHAPGWSPEET